MNQKSFQKRVQQLQQIANDFNTYAQSWGGQNSGGEGAQKVATTKRPGAKKGARKRSATAAS